MSEAAKNPNAITSELLLIDEKPTILEKRIQDARTLLSLADKALPLEKKSSIQLNEQDSLAIKAKDCVENVKAFFAADSELLLNDGLRSMGAKLSKADWCDNSIDMQALEFVMRFSDLSKEDQRPDLYDRMVTTVAYLRAAKMAKDKLSEKKGHLFVNADDVSQEIHSDSKYLESAYKELQKDHGKKFNEFLDFVKESGQNLEQVLSQNNRLPEVVARTSERLTGVTVGKDTIIGDDIAKLDQCIKDAGLLQLAMIPTPYDEVVDVSDLPEEEATAYILHNAYKELAQLGGHHSPKELSEFKIDHGLRALGDKLGDPEYHGPQYGVQLIAFALRFNQLVGEEGQNPNIKNRIKNVATYLRSAKLAEDEMEKEGKFFISSSEIAEKANDPALIQRSWKELSAYDNALFNEFYDNMKRVSDIIVNALKKVQENPQWNSDYFKQA